MNGLEDALTIAVYSPMGAVCGPRSCEEVSEDRRIDTPRGGDTNGTRREERRWDRLSSSGTSGFLGTTSDASLLSLKMSIVLVW